MVDDRHRHLPVREPLQARDNNRAVRDAREPWSGQADARITIADGTRARSQRDEPHRRDRPTDSAAIACGPTWCPSVFMASEKAAVVRTGPQNRRSGQSARSGETAQRWHTLAVAEVAR